jgi:hypothetical protein
MSASTETEDDMNPVSTHREAPPSLTVPRQRPGIDRGLSRGRTGIEGVTAAFDLGNLLKLIPKVFKPF